MENRRKTNFIRLDIKDCPSLYQYEIGDSLAVFPKNPTTLVSKVLKRCRTSFDPDELIKLEINAYHDQAGVKILYYCYCYHCYYSYYDSVKANKNKNIRDLFAKTGILIELC